jgi:hypothetical protein
MQSHSQLTDKAAFPLLYSRSSGLQAMAPSRLLQKKTDP